MKTKVLLLGVVCLPLAGCVTVTETALSTNQQLAIVDYSGNGLTAPTTVVLLKDRRGKYAPIGTGFAQAPVTAILTGAAAGTAAGLVAGRVREATTVKKSTCLGSGNAVASSIVNC
jgi:pheromone shutdown protein TraB